MEWQLESAGHAEVLIKGINSCVAGMIHSVCLVVLLLGLVVFHNVFYLIDRGPGVLLEGVYRKRVKHIVQDTGGKKVEIVTINILSQSLMAIVIIHTV